MEMKAILGALLAAALVGGSGFAQDPAAGAGVNSLFRPGATGSGADISGTWMLGGHQDVAYITASGALVDYGGIPFNEAGRLYALAWSASRQTVREEQCAGYTIPYAFYSPGNYRFWEERDPQTQRLIAIHMYFQTSEVNRTIWMDGRPHPPAWAAHTFAGFSTGEWKGNVLHITTTHLKHGYVRGNGASQSDEATVHEALIRHGDRMTYFAETIDPVWFDGPFTKTVINVRNIIDPTAWLYACEDGEEILSRDDAAIPAYPWGQHPFLREYADKNRVPLLGALGGAETTRPEFMTKLRDASATEAAGRVLTVPASGVPPQSNRGANSEPVDGEIHTLAVQGNVYMLVGDGGNITVQIGDQGPFVVDTGAGKLSPKVIAAIRALSPRPIQFIVNTSLHSPHTGGNASLAAAGEDPSIQGSFFAGQAPVAATGFFADPAHRATLIAHNNVLVRMQTAKAPAEAIPPDTYLRERRRKWHNSEGIDMFYEPNASTDGDTIVHFRQSDVIATGDIFDMTRYPFIDLANGGSVKGEIDALNNILEKTVYKHDEDGGTMIVPGHGRLADEYDVGEYRAMITIIRDRIQRAINAGASLDQVKAARLTADYDTRFGATTGPWTTDMFVEAVYTSLKSPPKTQNRN
jgi:glyoxylase-like metal-dependent hydrolase (beta-lactamase superfamily II)